MYHAGYVCFPAMISQEKGHLEGVDTLTFSTVFIALYTGHSVGDHWIQTGHQSARKHLTGWEGRLPCLRHVITLTLTKAVLVSVPVLLSGLRADPFLLCAGFLLDAASHYWADRRTTLERLTGQGAKRNFYHLGADTLHVSSPHGSHTGTGKYVLDQSFHHFFLFVSSVIISL
jgi:hypothetical protein